MEVTIVPLSLIVLVLQWMEVLWTIFGGGLHKSYVGTSTVVINGGTIKGGVQGGGASSYAKTTCHRPWYDGDRANAPTVVDNAIVTINGGKFYNVYGGGEGISYTKMLY